MKVLFYSPTGHLGGAERSLMDVLRSLKLADPSLELSLLTASPGDLTAAASGVLAETRVLPLPKILLERGERFFQWSEASQVISALSAYLRDLRKTFEAARPDIIHTNGIKCHILASLARPRGTVLIWHIRDFLGSRRITRRLVWLVGRRANAAIAISKAVQRDFNRAVPYLKAYLVLNAIDTNLFCPGTSKGSRLDLLAGMSQVLSPVLRVGLVATYSKWKGHHVFLRAVKETVQPSVGFPMRFFIVGGPIYETAGSQYSESELRKASQLLGLQNVVGFVPFQQDVAQVYRDLDVVVHASEEPEPFGRTIAEAMACSKPVVVSAAGGALEIGEHERDCLYFPPGDHERLAALLVRLAKEPELCDQLGRAGRLRVEKKFSHTRMGSEILEIYAEVTRNRGLTLALQKK